MRTILLLLGTVVLLAGGFALYWMVQSGGPARQTAAGVGAGLPKPLAVQQSETTYTVGGGKGVWLKQYDEIGRLTHQFRADEYDPQKEGFVRVAKPEARFFMKGGQWIRVTGNTGDVYVSGLPEAGAGGGGGDLFAPSGSGGGPAGTPSRGRLQDVRIGLFETPDAAQPSIEMEMNNAAFDNESFRIYTEAYTDTEGKQIAADQVKVTVRGKYEFDGQGLTIRWNDRDQRLELLEIAHGERLVIKEPGLIRAKAPGHAGKPAAPAARLSRGAGPAQATGVVAAPALEPADPLTALASADPAAAAAAQAVEPESNHYILFLYDNVQMLQGEETIALADSVEVHYAARNTPRAAKPTATAPAAAPPPPPQPAPDAAADPQPAPATQPAAEPQQPVTVYWTGKLRITPSVSGPPVYLAPEQAAVQMRGTPVVLTRGNAVIKCPALTYRTSDGGATLHTSEVFPQVQIAQYATAKRTGEPEMTLFSEWVEYAPGDGVATLGGKSRAEFPADDTSAPTGVVAAAAKAVAADGGPEMARVTWTREGVVRFAPAAGGGDDASVVQDLNLAGDVDVQHPQVSLKSQKLSLAFAPPDVDTDAANPDAPPGDGDKAASSRLAIKQVTADESVHCVLPDGPDASRELTCDHLDLLTALDPAGRMYANVVKARGNVRAVEGGQELSTEDLELTLLPATPGAAKPDAEQAAAHGGAAKAFGGGQVELQKLVAKSRVRAVSKDGAVATGSSLVVTNADGKAIVGLSGKPARMVSAEGNVLTSEKIVAMPDSDEAQAIGPGSLRAAVEDAAAAAAGTAPRFMEVSWTESAILNGSRSDDQIQVTGDVKASLPEADGTVNTARAHRILITMADKPAEPDDAAGEGKAPKAKKEDAAGALAAANADVMKGKEVSRIVLVQDAVVDRRLRGEDGSVLREMQIESSLLHYNVKDERFVVPRPGRMLVRDHTDPEDAKPAPAEAVASATNNGGFGKQRGATAFQWAESLDYDGVARRASMKQDVVVAFRPDGEGELPVQLRSDNVVAEFEAPEQDPAAAAKPTDASKPGGPDALVRAPAPKLKTVTADGNVNVVRGDQELSALKLTFTPARSTIVATGSKTNPAVFSRAGRPDNLSATEIHWNTETWDVKVIGGAARVGATR